MAIHWQIKFRSLRADTLYTVNIYDANYSGTPVELIGGAQPFVTDEEDEDDFFAPIRIQTGYIRIVDTEKDTNGNPFNWRELIPTTDTDRPVTLTDGNGAVVWQGFMQAQNFSGRLYEVPQEREFPVQCALSVLSRQDINANQFNGVVNFAALLNYIIGTIPSLTWNKIIIQGGADARAWLLKRFDWMVFMDSDGEGKYDIGQVVEDFCRYWGWAWRTHGQNIYLLCPDDTALPDLLELTPANLQTMAAGTAAGTIVENGYSQQTIGDVFASTENTDTQVRGHNHASLTAEAGDIDERIVFCYPDAVQKEMYDKGFDNSSVLYDYTRDLTTFNTGMMSGTAYSNGSFNIMRLRANPSRDESLVSVVRCKAGYGTTAKASLQSERMHIYTDGYLKLKAKIYRGGEEFQDADKYPPYWGNKHMTMRLGIGTSRSMASWWNGAGWSHSETTFYAKIGGSGDTLFTCKEKGEGKTVMSMIPTGGFLFPLSSEYCYGHIFIDFLGSDDIDSDSSKRAIDIADFELTFERTGELWRYNDPDRHSDKEYTAKNDSVVKSEWSGGTVYASEDYSQFGPGVVVNTDNSYFKGWDYANHEDAAQIVISLPGYQPINLNQPQAPEQHMVDRVVSYWSLSRRKIECELRKELITDITPRTKLTIDGTTLYPLSVGHDWRDDVVRVIAMEV